MKLLAALLSAPLMVQAVTVVDVEAVRVDGDPSAALRTFTVPPNPREVRCDILVAGAGTGGVAAAMRAAQRGHSVCLTEETGWVGGQLTAGGVSALDENRFIEISGGTRSYYELREGIRDHYRKQYKLSASASKWQNLNPGSCYVSSLCYEPKVGLAVLQRMLARYPKIDTHLRTIIFAIDRSGGRVESALAYRFESKEVIRFRFRYVLDATELGDLLPLAKVPYVAGSEPQSDTKEPHASAEANPACVQSFTYPFAIEARSGENHKISKPPDYERIRDHQPFTIRMNYPTEYGWKGIVQYTMFGDDPPVPNNMSPRPFFSWRRLLAAKNFNDPRVPRDVALMNWPRQDYHDESILDRSPQDFARILQAAKRVSFAFLYWLQTDVPRDDGKGAGYPELMLRRDMMGTEDGMSKFPYIRESRRLKAQGRVVQQDIVIDDPARSRARAFDDSIGTGFYMVDIHPCGANEKGRMMMPKPFQVPMSALLPRGVGNLLPAAKNIGVTHLTNGAFRLHPIEWNVGESAAVIASLTLESGSQPSHRAVQDELVKAGVSIVWFDDLSVSHPAFAAIQWAAIRSIYPLNNHDLHASPDAPLTRGEAASALAAYFGKPLSRDQAIALAVEQGWMAVDHRNWFHADLPFYWTDWREQRFPKALPRHEPAKTGPVTRAELARRLYQ